MLFDMFISVANASEVATDAASQPSVLQSIMPMLLIFAVFYFFIIRPQSKKYKELQTAIDNTKIGDEVVVLSGLFGKITSIDQDNTCMVEIAKGCEIKVSKTAISKNLSLAQRKESEVQRTIGKGSKK